MSGPVTQDTPERATTMPAPGVLRGCAWLLNRVNAIVFSVSMLALLVASAILTGGVLLRYFFKVPTDWQDEASVFLIVGAVFLSGAYVQSYRGHVGIEALASVLPPRLNRIRRWACDVVSGLFCTFYGWKSWTLFHEAWSEGQTTSSAWAPPLWIPYGLMAAGMTLLALQIALQVLAVDPDAPSGGK